MPNPPHQENNPTVAELPATASAQEVAEIVRRDGGVIIKNFISADTIAQIDRELAPHWQRKGVYKGDLFNANDPPLR
jgi:hypothetical protein